MKPCLSIVFLLATLPVSAQITAAATGSICGMVLNEHGQRAALVHVTAFYMGPHTGIMDGGTTDENGQYCLEGVRFGEYVMSADDPKKGYPPMVYSFFSEDPPNVPVVLSALTPKAHADWQIPFKAAVIRIKLTDAMTGKPLINMSYTLALRIRPETYLHGSSAASQDLLIPPNQDVLLTVTADGYQRWPDDGTKTRIVNLAPGTIQNFDIALRPEVH